MIRCFKNILFPTSSEEQNEQEVFNFFWARKLLYTVTPLWLIYYFFEFIKVTTWPDSIYFTQHWYGELFAFSRPSLWLFSGVVLVGVISSMWFYYKSSITQRLICLLVILWVNSVNWTTGHSAHVAHVLIYIHLFSLFIPKEISAKEAASIRWVYLGVFITYTFAGIWKVVGLCYKWFFTGESMNWFHPEAALRNAISGHIDAGISFDRVSFLFEYPIVWQLLFPVMLLLQLFNFAGAFNQRLRALIVIGDISFHVVNSLVFLISFWFTPLLLAVLFFPYHKIKPIIKG